MLNWEEEQKTAISEDCSRLDSLQIHACLFLPISTILMTSASPAKTESGHRRILMAVLRQPKWEASITIYRTNGKDTTIKVGENNRIFFRMVIHTIDRGIMPITRKQKY